MKRILLFIALACAMCACKQTPAVQPASTNRYAQGFELTADEAATHIRILSPWKPGEVLAEISVPADKPFCKLNTTSATHVGFLHALEADSLVAGCCDRQLVYNLPAGAADLGSSLALDAERVIASEADLVLVSTYQDDDKDMLLLGKIGIAALPICEWTEQHPLARAEWIRVIGALVGKQAEADSIFSAVCEQYNSLAANAAAERPTIVSGGTWQGTWYVPSGRTYMAQLFRDAGASYAFDADSTEGSIPLSFEQALLAFKDADVWVGAPANTLEALRGMNDKHCWFRAFEQGRVYHFDKRSLPAGANDFWETGVVRPDLVLRDLQTILRNEPDSLLYFSDRLK